VPRRRCPRRPTRPVAIATRRSHHWPRARRSVGPSMDTRPPMRCRRGSGHRRSPMNWSAGCATASRARWPRWGSRATGLRRPTFWAPRTASGRPNASTRSRVTTWRWPSTRVSWPVHQRDRRCAGCWATPDRARTATTTPLRERLPRERWTPPASAIRRRTRAAAASLWPCLVSPPHRSKQGLAASARIVRSQDVPRQRRVRTTRGRVGLLVAAVVIFILIISLRGIAGFYTDFLWFQELHLTSVWRSILGAKVGLAALFTVLFFVLMWVNLAIADRIAPAFRPMGPEEELVERYHQVVGPRALLVRTAVSALFALIAGPSVASHWNQWILFTHHVPFNAKDPQFHKDIGFYVFQLPFLKFLVDWLFASTIIILIVTAVAHYLNGGIRVQAIQKVTPQVKAHLSVLLGILALLKAAGYYLQRYELNFSTRGVVQGASYTDVHAQLPALKLLIVISLFAAVLLLYNIVRRGWALPVIAVGLWAFVSIIIGAAYPAFIQQFKVNPTESKKERP